MLLRPVNWQNGFCLANAEQNLCAALARMEKLEFFPMLYESSIDSSTQKFRIQAQNHTHKDTHTGAISQ
jgi:hypothetical protein